MPNSISHKQLNSLLAKARKQPLSSHDSISLSSKEQESFEELLVNWSSLSRKLLDELQRKHDYIVEGKKPQAIMALGALAAHLNMAIQARNASNLE